MKTRLKIIPAHAVKLRKRGLQCSASKKTHDPRETCQWLAVKQVSWALL